MSSRLMRRALIARATKLMQSYIDRKGGRQGAPKSLSGK
ncbi:Conserved hypothetical protein [Prochlorococcus marinus str. MIT 9313]|uniref:Uncharacterized protein n=1 Tax=Prochlorococcus marinus (strain MIT 9313) TaxID=74547 RepID=B9ER89_PROMM|nr:Conserved hypothetical protein [Prochlorococcus marinus str. MIT 9313]